jgi:RHS repeat-associated protein
LVQLEAKKEHVDHLNTPRLIANSSGQSVWRWDAIEPFGTNPPDENPLGLGVFKFPLRHPGQYDDEETGLFYNDQRDGYNAAIGGYTQPEPLGVRGDINLYRYARSSPLRFVDRDGMQAAIGGGAAGGSGLGGLGGFGGRGVGGKSSTGSAELDRALRYPTGVTSSSMEDDAAKEQEKKEAARLKCEADCDKDYDRDRAWCEARWKMKGRQASEYRDCMEDVRSKYLKCYERCKEECK